MLRGPSCIDEINGIIIVLTCDIFPITFSTERLFVRRKWKNHVAQLVNWVVTTSSCYVIIQVMHFIPMRLIHLLVSTSEHISVFFTSFFFHYYQHVQISFQHSQTCHRAEDHPRPFCLFPSTRFFLLFSFFNSHRTHLIPHPAISLHTYRPSSSDMAQLPLSPSPAPALVYSHLCAHDVFGIVPWWRVLCQS